MSRATFQKMEKGDLSISLGAYINAARIYSSLDTFNELFNADAISDDLFKEFGAKNE